MATAHLVLAHPGTTSLSHKFTDTIHAALVSRGITVDRLDLNRENFAPALTQTERESYYSSNPDLAPNHAYTQRLLMADMLVLVFPTWWFGQPAILKGWVDRTFAPTIAFDHADHLGPIKPRLTSLKSVLIVTTLGSPWWVDWFVMRRPVRRILKTAIFGMCAPQAKFQMLSLYSAEKPEQSRVDNFTSKILKALARQ